MPGNEPDLEAMADLMTPWCLRVAATLRVADYLAEGPVGITDLAAAAGCDARALSEILGHLAERGVFAELRPGQFALNDAGRALADPALQIGLDLDGIGGRFAHAWGTLLTYARTGSPGFDQIYGVPFWEDLSAHPDIAASFDALIGPVGHGRPALFEMTVGWDKVSSVVDVGGGTGSMLAEILRAHDHLHGTLVDLPRTVARSGEVFATAGVSGRVTLSGQSFFDPLPAGADVYVVKNVLHDWPDAESGAILRRCAEAARPGGRVVTIGAATPDASLPRLDLVTVLTGGRTSTLPEFTRLAAENGLRVVDARSQPPGFVVECVSV